MPRYLITLITALLMMGLIGCQNRAEKQAAMEKQMFDWINTMTTCPKLSATQYPPLDPKLQAQYEDALALSRADGPVDQVKITALYKEAAEQGHWPSMHNLAVRYYQGKGAIQKSDGIAKK